ncbi:MAG TPA: citrate/2-methylcitrate synthase [Candidatus Binataceae bacterium]
MSDVAAHPTNSGAQMLTAGEAAAQLGVKLGTLYAYVSRGWLKSYRRKVGRQALYRRADIEALRGVIAPERGVRARSLPDASSWVTVAQPPSDGSSTGVIVAESAVSSIIEGKLAYRGYPIEELVEHASFEEVCLLLWSGERPRPEEIDHLRDGIAAARLPAPVVAALAAVGADAPPLLRLAVMMPSLAAAEHRLPARSRIDQARMIITVLPLGLAPLAHEGGVSAGGASRAAGGDGGMAARLCGRVLADPAAADREALDRVLVACAEHELNASTFAARVVASTGADLYASVLAALCSLSGPIHGGACDRIESMFAELDAGTRIEQALDAFGAKHSLPPGFGHTIYPSGDPRAVLLKRVARATAKRKGRKLFETALKFEEAVWKRARLRPNLDFYLTVCVRMVGFPRGMPAAIFAMGRAAGWIAHSLEQSADNRLIRPRMRYHGSPLRHWQ